MLVPQFAQLNAPTADLFDFFPPPLAVAPPLPVAAAAPAEGLPPTSTPGDDMSTPAVPVEGDWSAAAAAGAGDETTSSPTAPVDAGPGTTSTSILPAETELFSVGQPAHALDPPVPSHRPSPGHVPLPAFEIGAPVLDPDEGFPVEDVVEGLDFVFELGLPAPSGFSDDDDEGSFELFEGGGWFDGDDDDGA